jgi:carboxymethylenebutenolidase
MRMLGALLVAGSLSVPAGAQNPPLEQSPEVRAMRARAEAVTYSPARKLVGWIYRPEGSGPFPTIIYNHGSEQNPIAFPGLALFYVKNGYAFFVPVRAGHGTSPGRYILEAQVGFRQSGAAPDAARQNDVAGHERSNIDVVEALAWLKSRPFVDTTRIAMSGVSYGGIQTLLIAEKGLGVKGFIPFSTAAQSWVNSDLRARLTRSVALAKAPIFFIQASNDFSIEPSAVLGAAIKAKGGANRAALYPAFGTTPQHGHGLFAISEAGSAIWGKDVLAFLRAIGM